MQNFLALHVRTGRDKLFAESQHLFDLDTEPILVNIVIQAAIWAVFQKKINVIGCFLAVFEFYNIGMVKLFPRLGLLPDPLHQIFKIRHDLYYLGFVHNFACKAERGIGLKPTDMSGCKGATAKDFLQVDNVFVGNFFGFAILLHYNYSYGIISDTITRYLAFI